MRVEVQVHDEDAAVLNRVLNAHRFENVDQLFHYALNKLDRDADLQLEEEDLTQAAELGLASGWYEGDPFERARAIVAAGRAERPDAA